MDTLYRASILAPIAKVLLNKAARLEQDGLDEVFLRQYVTGEISDAVMERIVDKMGSKPMNERKDPLLHSADNERLKIAIQSLKEVKAVR